MNQLTNFQEQQLEKYACAIEQRAMYTFRYIFDTGEILNAARIMFPGDREFGQWRKQRLPWLHEHIARHWMNVNKKFRYLSQRDDYYCLTLSELPPAVVYQLAAPSTTEEVIDKVIEQVQEGKKIVVQEVKNMSEKNVHRRGVGGPSTVSVECNNLGKQLELLTAIRKAIKNKDNERAVNMLKEILELISPQS